MKNEEKLKNSRHSLAHLLAAAVMELYPYAKRAIGPSIDSGFYYDFEFVSPVSDKDLLKIENRMREILKTWKEFTHQEKTYEEAKKESANNEYKIELINEIKNKDEKINFYTCGNFTDLCQGGHAENSSKDIAPNSFKLDRVAGAYWRGNEKNKMLTRIYGLAFETKEELDAYIKQREETEKRDHRKLGKELKLFMISEEVGKGLPLWLPNGAFIRHQLEDYMYQKELANGYKYVYTPVLTHKNLYETSGHLAHYREDMYSPIEIEGEEYYLKPMNCPHHHMIYRNSPFSYKDLPLRLAESGLCHRFERSGVLTGLIRARCFTQNDSHIYCAKKNLKKELLAVLQLFKEVYNDFNIKNYWYRLSFPDFSNQEKYGDIQNKDMWNEAGRLTEEALKEFGAKFAIGVGEASFYGPKIDIQVKNVNGKEDTIATVQVDFYSPNKFNLYYTNEKGEKEHPVIIHRAIMGSFDRFFAFLVEQTAGNFPLWLSPVQAKVIPVRSSHNEYAKQVYELLKENNIRAELDDEEANLGGKVRDAKNNKIPYWIVIGDKEIEAAKITLESRDKGQLGQMSKKELVERLLKEIKNKK